MKQSSPATPPRTPAAKKAASHPSFPSLLATPCANVDLALLHSLFDNYGVRL
jgi:hypothetical protein